MVWFCLAVGFVAAVLVTIAGIREMRELDRAMAKPGKGSYPLGRLAIIPVSLAGVGVWLMGIKAVEPFAVGTEYMPLIGVGCVGAGAVLGLLVLGIHFLISCRARRLGHFLSCALLGATALLLCLIGGVVVA